MIIPENVFQDCLSIIDIARFPLKWFQDKAFQSFYKTTCFQFKSIRQVFIVTGCGTLAWMPQ